MFATVFGSAVSIIQTETNSKRVNIVIVLHLKSGEGIYALLGMTTVYVVGNT